MAALGMEELRQRRRVQLIRLMEVSDLTKQLGQALDRKDEISFQMLLTMRQTPIQQLDEMERGVQTYLMQLPPEDAIRCKQLLDGAEPEEPEEGPLYDQVGQYRRTLKVVLEEDRQLSLRLGGKKSLYRYYNIPL